MPVRLFNIDVVIQKDDIDDIFPDMKSIELYRKQILSVFKDNHLKGRVKVEFTYKEILNNVDKV